MLAWVVYDKEGKEMAKAHSYYIKEAGQQVFTRPEYADEVAHKRNARPRGRYTYSVVPWFGVGRSGWILKSRVKTGRELPKTRKKRK